MFRYWTIVSIHFPISFSNFPNACESNNERWKRYLVNSITSQSCPYYPTYSKSIPTDVYGGWNLFRSHPPSTDTDDIFRGWYSKIGGLSVEGSVSFRRCGVRHRGRKSDTFHIIHCTSSSGRYLVLARNPFQPGRWRWMGTRVGRGLPH